MEVLKHNSFDKLCWNKLDEETIKVTYGISFTFLHNQRQLFSIFRQKLFYKVALCNFFVYGKIMTYLDLFDAKTYWQLHTKTCIATRNQFENLLITILAMCNFIFHSKRHFTMLQLILEILTNEYSFSLTFLVNCFGLNNPYLHLAPCH